MTRQSAKFAWLEAYAYNGDKTLQRSVMMVLLHHADANTLECHPSERTLAEACGISDRAVRSQIAANKAAGWVTVTQRYDRPNLYTLTAPEWNSGSAPTSQEDETGSLVQGDRKSASTHTGSKLPPNRSLDRSGTDQVPVIDQKNTGSKLPEAADVPTAAELEEILSQVYEEDASQASSGTGPWPEIPPADANRSLPGRKSTSALVWPTVKFIDLGRLCECDRGGAPRDPFCEHDQSPSVPLGAELPAWEMEPVGSPTVELMPSGGPSWLDDEPPF